MRGVAVISVIAQHVMEKYYHLPYFNFGRFGVLLFFLISGFVIPYSIVGKTLRQFAIARFWRLYPAYWASLAIVLSLGHFSLATSLANLTMLQGAMGYPDALGPYWSLLFELIFYALSAVLALAASLGSVRRVGALCLTFLGLGVIFTTSNSLFATQFQHQDGFQFLGFMLAGAAFRHDNRRWTAAVCVALVLSAVVGGGALFPVPANGNEFFTPTALTLSSLAPVAVYLAWTRWEWASAPVQWVGLVSYSAYLFHPIVIQFVPERLAFGNFLAATLMGTAFIAWLSYTVIERPSHATGKTIAQRMVRPSLPKPAPQI